VLDLPEVRESAHLEVVFRLGDSESLQRLQERCEDVTTRPAGWSAHLDGHLPYGRAGRTSEDPAVLRAVVTYRTAPDLGGSPAFGKPRRA
jgi:hypothetical protein